MVYIRRFMCGRQKADTRQPANKNESKKKTVLYSHDAHTKSYVNKNELPPASLRRRKKGIKDAS